MRKKERERTGKEFFYQVLDKAREFTIALKDEEFPYIIPLNFACEDNILYFHCAQAGKKIDLIKKNPALSFCAMTDIEILEEKASTAYKSVCGTGIAHIIENAETKEKALQLIAKKYNAHCTFPTPKALFDETAVVAIEIKSLTGKERLNKKPV